MNESHQRLATTAARLIKKHGASMSLRKTSKTSGPDWNPAVSNVDVQITGVRDTFSQQEISNSYNRQSQNSRIQSSDIKILIDSEHDPREFEKLIDGVSELQIINVDVVAPGDVSIVYNIQARL